MLLQLLLLLQLPSASPRRCPRFRLVGVSWSWCDGGCSRGWRCGLLLLVEEGADDDVMNKRAAVSVSVVCEAGGGLDIVLWGREGTSAQKGAGLADDGVGDALLSWQVSESRPRPAAQRESTHTALTKESARARHGRGAGCGSGGQETHGRNSFSSSCQKPPTSPRPPLPPQPFFSSQNDAR